MISQIEQLLMILPILVQLNFIDVLLIEMISLKSVFGRLLASASQKSTESHFSKFFKNFKIFSSITKYLLNFSLKVLLY